MATRLTGESSVAISFLGHRIEVESSDRSILERVAHGFEHFHARSIVRSREMLRVSASGDGYRMARAEAPIAWCPDRASLFRALRHEIIRGFVLAHPHLLWLHAGAAVLGDRAVLFSGASGRGKSTLVTALCARGWNYASDDIAPIDPASQRLIPFPLSPLVRRPDRLDSSVTESAAVTKERVVVSTKAVVHRPTAVGGIVFPEYVRGTAGELRPDGSAAAALELVEQGINRSSLGASAVALAAALVHETPTYRLRFDDAAAAADLVEREFGQARRAAASA